MLRNDETCFKNLAVFTLQDFKVRLATLGLQIDAKGLGTNVCTLKILTHTHSRQVD